VNPEGPVLRPVIVTSVSRAGERLPVRVRGLLIFDNETDRHLPWTQLHSKVTPLLSSPVAWVSGSYGRGLGEWRYPGDFR
jgi:hypothetical protein